MPLAPTDIAIDLRGFLPSSLSEWDDRIVAVVFTAGCNWRCPFCHGRQFIQDPRALPRVPVATVLEHLRAQTGWIDGVVVSGGEPTLQPGLADFLEAVRARGVATRIQSNGSRPEVLASLIEKGLLDGICLDYKAPLDDGLAAVTRAPEATNREDVRRSFALARESGLEREYRTTLCPAFVDAEALDRMGRDLEPGGVWSLQPYETVDVLDLDAAGSRTYDESELAALAEVARTHHPRVVLRGGRHDPH